MISTRVKLLIASASTSVGAFIASFAHAEYTTSTLATDIAPILDDVVQAGLAMTISFLTTNWPLIALVSIGIGLVFWLYYKFRAGLRGR